MIANKDQLKKNENILCKNANKINLPGHQIENKSSKGKNPNILQNKLERKKSISALSK